MVLVINMIIFICAIVCLIILLYGCEDKLIDVKPVACNSFGHLNFIVESYQVTLYGKELYRTKFYVKESYYTRATKRYRKKQFTLDKAHAFIAEEYQL